MLTESEIRDIKEAAWKNQIVHVHPPDGPNGLHEPAWAQAWKHPRSSCVSLTSNDGLTILFPDIDSAREFVDSIQDEPKAYFEDFPDENPEHNYLYPFKFLKGWILQCKFGYNPTVRVKCEGYLKDKCKVCTEGEKWTLNFELSPKVTK